MAGQLRPLKAAKTSRGLSRYCRGTTAIRRREKWSGVGTQISNSFCAGRGVEMKLRLRSGRTREKQGVWVGMVGGGRVWRGVGAEESGVEQQQR